MSTQELNKEHNLNDVLQFVWPALELSQQRMNEANRRLETLAGLSLAAFPVVISLSDQRDLSVWLLLALGCAFLACITAGVARGVGTIHMLVLATVAEGSVRSPSAFREWLIEEAGERIQKNSKVIRRRWQAAGLASILLGAEFVFLALAVLYD